MKINNSRVKKIMIGTAALLCTLGMTACGNGESGTKVVFTTGFAKDEIFRIEDEICKEAELMVYLTTTQNQYEEVYGEEIWNIARDGVTLEENVKETVLAKIAQIKTMCLLAEEKEVALDELEEEKVLLAAEEFWQSLSQTEVELLGVNQELIEEMYHDYALADKVYQYIIQDVNPEISDDEARTITVQHIYMRTWSTDETGNRVPYSDAVKQAIYEKISEVRQLAVDGEHDFMELASKYSEDPAISHSFGKGEMEAVYESTAFQLETDEVSKVLETESGYYIIKCVNTFNREETDANKLQIVEQRKKEVFTQEYDQFISSLVRKLNQEVWEGITLLHNDELTTSNFFEIYHKYFPEKQ